MIQMPHAWDEIFSESFLIRYLLVDAFINIYVIRVLGFITFSSPVGCALAGLVLMVLVAYLVGEDAKLKKYIQDDNSLFSGRRKSRARGYQSV